MSFPTCSAWYENVLHPRDRIATQRSPWCFETLEWHQHYRGLHDIAKALRPESILEIGVRYGYSAHALLLGAELKARYLGVDCDDGALNGMGEPTLEWAQTMLIRTVPGLNMPAFIKTNTQTKDLLQLVPWHFDLVHVDADHSYHGCLRDLRAAWARCSGTILVDDYDTIAAVHDAVDTLVKGTQAKCFTAPGGNGQALIFMAGALA